MRSFITRRPKSFDYIFFTFDFSCIWLYFPVYGKPYFYYDIEIMALGRPFHRKNIIFSKYFRISLETWQGVVSCWIVIAWSPKYLDTYGLRYFSKISMYFCVSVVSEVGTISPTPLEVTQPQNWDTLVFFVAYKAWIIFLIWFLPNIKLLIILCRNHGLNCEKTVFHGSGVQFIFSQQNFIHFYLFAALMTFYIFRILLLSPNWLMCLLTFV